MLLFLCNNRLILIYICLLFTNTRLLLTRALQYASSPRGRGEVHAEPTRPLAAPIGVAGGNTVINYLSFELIKTCFNRISMYICPSLLISFHSVHR